MATFSVTCPHCHALLDIDPEARVIAGSKPVEKPKTTVTLDERMRQLGQDKQVAQAKVDEAMRAEKSGAALREEKFRKLLEGAAKEPATRPIKDIDLD